MANMLTNAIHSYIRATPPSTIELVDVVVYQHEIIPYYLEALKVATQENASTETTLVAEWMNFSDAEWLDLAGSQWQKK